MAAANAAVVMDEVNNRKITKKRSTAHVDGLVALLMAVGTATLQPAEKDYQIVFV